MDELERETANPVRLGELIEAETAEEKTANRRRLLEKAVSLPVHDGGEEPVHHAQCIDDYPRQQQQRFDAETADWGGDLDSDPPTRPN